MSERALDTGVVLTIASGGVACGDGRRLGPVHDAITHILGWDVFTHELAYRPTWDRASELILASVPALTPFAEQLRAATGSESGAQAALDAAVAVVGPTVELPKGGDGRTEHPLESMERIAPGNHIVVVRQ